MSYHGDDEIYWNMTDVLTNGDYGSGTSWNGFDDNTTIINFTATQTTGEIVFN